MLRFNYNNTYPQQGIRNMRYFIDFENVRSLDELRSRKAFIEDVAKLYFVLQCSIGGFIVLQSFPFIPDPDICLIYAHNYNVADLINNYINEINESNIFIISCLHGYKRAFLATKKKIYICPQEKEYVKLRYGKPYGFDFDITDVELNLYNSPYKTITEKLLSCFNLLIQ